MKVNLRTIILFIIVICSLVMSIMSCIVATSYKCQCDTQEVESTTEEVETTEEIEESTDSVENTENADLETEEPSPEPTIVITTEETEEETISEPTEDTEEESSNIVNLGQFRLTAYCNCSRCCGVWAGGPTASGAMPVAGYTIAVDTSVIPMWSEVIINGHTYVAQDTGSAIVGNRIDIYFDTHEEALEFGVRYADVYLVTE